MNTPQSYHEILYLQQINQFCCYTKAKEMWITAETTIMPYKLSEIIEKFEQIEIVQKHLLARVKNHSKR